MNFYKHHLGDYAAATVHLSWDEDCAYRRLMEQYYKREVPIPRDTKEACRLARATTPVQRRAVEAVLREFFLEKEDGWHQKRCDEEISAANNQAETNRRIAEEREAKRRARTDNESSNGSSNEPPNETSTNRSPDTTGERAESVNLSRLQTPDSISQTPREELTPLPPSAPKPKPSTTNRAQSLADARAVTGLDIPSFDRWIDYRAARKPALKPVSYIAAAEDLAKHGTEQAAVVQQSVANGWQGLFPLKLNGGHAGPEPRKTRFDQLQETLDNA